jgi:hypothetical protein
MLTNLDEYTTTQQTVTLYVYEIEVSSRESCRTILNFKFKDYQLQTPKVEHLSMTTSSPHLPSSPHRQRRQWRDEEKVHSKPKHNKINNQTLQKKRSPYAINDSKKGQIFKLVLPIKPAKKKRLGRKLQKENS